MLNLKRGMNKLSIKKDVEIKLCANCAMNHL